jgi:O-antigen ligase
MILNSLFIFLLLPIVLFSGSGIWLQIYGTYGRNTGALTYFALALLLLSTVFATNAQFLKKFLQVVIVLGILLIFYGQIQNQGLDPFPFQNLYGSNVFGTLGNPNFMSAFMGMVAVVAVGLTINKGLQTWIKLCLILISLAALVTIFETNSVQGFLNFLAGIASLLIIWLFMIGKSKVGYVLSSIAGIGGGLVFLGIVNIGPLASYLFKSSLQARGFYWRAAINMLLTHPLFGIGMDGYGDWYRRSRTLKDTLLSPATNTDTAHSVFLDIASNGGFPLIVVYLAVLTLVLVSIVKVVRRSKEFNVFFATAAGAWIAYQAQSIISINAIGLAIWGWILSGLIIGYEINTRNQNEDSPVNSNKIKRNYKNQKSETLSSATLVSLFTTSVIAALLALPPYIAANNFYRALKSGSALEVQQSAYLKPFDRVRFTFVASNLAQNNLNEEALNVIRDAAKHFPNSFDVWSIYAKLPNASVDEIIKARNELRRLDPHNPEYK